MLLFVFASEEEEIKFNTLYQRYKKVLFQRAYTILKDQMLAEDAVSEAFLRAYKNLHKIGAPEDPQSAAFLLTIVRNTALTLWQKRNRLGESELIEEGYTQTDTPESITLDKLNAQRVCSLIDQLGEEYRSVFLLKYAHSCSHKEIAQILKTTENNIHVRLFRARKKLAKLLQKEENLS